MSQRCITHSINCAGSVLRE